jgi:hypothetical protein
MIDYFSKLAHANTPKASVQRFYEVAGLHETFTHVTLVADEARSLAAQHSVSDQAAHLAALAHDLAAGIPVPEMPAVAEKMGVKVGDADRAIPIILHGPIAAAALITKLSIHDLLMRRPWFIWTFSWTMPGCTSGIPIPMPWLPIGRW